LASPGEFAWRLNLPIIAHWESNLYGCAVIKFKVNSLYSVTAPPSASGRTVGLTGNGAREWWINTNIPLAADMQVTYIEAASSGLRAYEIPL
jgi:hypothetical protein